MTEQMTERQITFIDVDENPLIVHLAKDRIQLFVVDSEPGLEGGELRGFAVALFAAYVGGPLVQRLRAAREQIDGVRGALAATGAHHLVAELDGSLRAITDATEAMTAAVTAVAPGSGEPEVTDEPALRIERGKSTRGPRAGDGGALLGWGWVRHVDDDDGRWLVAA